MTIEDDVATLLKDPTVVHWNMLRGSIAMPKPANIWHLYGDDALIAAMPQSAVFKLIQKELPA